MLHIKRPLAPPEFELHAKKESSEASEFFRSGASSQRRFDFKIPRIPLVRQALSEVFHSKCAFCETPLGASSEADVDYFRPRRGAVGLDGKASEHHYWWLAQSWTNLYWSCPYCNRSKANRFPVKGKRAEIGEDPAAEEALLLDPCVDVPSEHLVFGASGEVASRTERGRITIEIFGLNRLGLVAARRDALRYMRDALDLTLDRLAAVADQSPSDRNISLERLRLTLQFETAAERPYSCLRRQFAAQWLHDAEAELGPIDTGFYNEFWSESDYISPQERRQEVETFRDERQRQAAFSVEASGDAYQLYGARRFIERIRIQNFKAIEDLTLTFPLDSLPEGEPWLMLLGENGYGKSSVLQAVALALAGQRLSNGLGLDASKFVRRGQPGGSVEVWMTGDPNPELATLTFRSDSSEFVNEPPEPKTLLVGYGAVRLLADGAHEMLPTSGQIRIENLFNPYIPLGDSKAWLLSLRQETFDRVAWALKRLLLLGDEVELRRNTMEHKIELMVGEHRSGDLASLSDGYQSVIALATDMMRFLATRWENVEDAVGIALVDELGLHLHPRWKMRIVSRVREVFPRMRFLVTTHDPLCLRGLREGEVAVMERGEDGRITVNTDLPPVASLRIEQILTSEHFGLDSATDPELDDMLHEYYQLLADPERNPKRRERLETLRASLEVRQILGDSPRERMMLQAIDEYLARARAEHRSSVQASLKSETQAKLAELWARGSGSQ